jgi:transcriptional regulator GlxA family with amidase domain
MRTTKIKKIQRDMYRYLVGNGVEHSLAEKVASILAIEQHSGIKRTQEENQLVKAAWLIAEKSEN